MRIIGGTLRSRSLQAPPGLATRPTSDRLRETLFNVLAPRIAGARFLDLFAGSGAVGLEAFSRGSARVEFVERGPAPLAALRKNLASLGILTGVSVHAGNVEPILRHLRPDFPFDLVFLDPPYDEAQAYQATLGLLGGTLAALLSPDALVIAEHRKKEQLEDRYGTLQRTRLLKQGEAALSFYTATLPHTIKAEDYSGTRVDVSRNSSIQVDATNGERRPSSKFVTTQLLWFRSKGACCRSI
jgi:16S rRNA (guanine(966)-N(2))-methyltransferase RsmD